MIRPSSIQLTLIVALLVLSGFSSVSDRTKPETSSIDVATLAEHPESGTIENLEDLNGWFTENRGQIGKPETRYVYAGSRCSVGFIESGYLVTLTDEDNRTGMMRASFQGANPVIPEGRGKCAHASNYFLGDDPSLWKTDVPNYNEVVYEGLYEGIDVVFYTTGSGLKYDFVVSPGADPGMIAWRYEGAT